jgi:hypothetical protein
VPKVFVYGALMTHEVALREGTGAYVADHAVRFVTRGLPFLEPSFALLVPAPGELAYGVIVPFEDTTWRRERRAEAPYATGVVTARSLRGEVHEAVALVRGVAPYETERNPSARYASLLHAGAAHHGLPEEVVARYASLRDAGPRLTLSFARIFGQDGEARVKRHGARRTLADE